MSTTDKARALFNRWAHLRGLPLEWEQLTPAKRAEWIRQAEDT